MGFMNAVYDIGLMRMNSREKDAFSDIDSYIQLAMPIINDDKRNGRELLICLCAEDPHAETLNITGIKDITLRDYMAFDGLDDVVKKRKYLYKEPSGSNYTWSYSPLYKLGKGLANARNAFLGDTEAWQSDKNSRLFKLRKTTLQAFEEKNVFSPGSADLILNELANRVDELALHWNDKNRSYILVFGVDHNGEFLYPGDLPAFLTHFRNSIANTTATNETPQKRGSKHSLPDSNTPCAICQTHVGITNFDELFAFSTFDKRGFLPGNDEKESGKVFPICSSCLPIFYEGKAELDNSFLDTRTVPGLKLYVVPEVVGETNRLSKISTKVHDFIRAGIKQEEELFSALARKDNSLIYNFMFWEQNQAQERILLSVEDVPPTRLKMLERCWHETLAVLPLSLRGDESDNTRSPSGLDHALAILIWTLMGMAGPRENEQATMRDWALSLMGKLLSGNCVDVISVKALFVSRFQGLFHDDKWLQFGETNIRRMVVLIDFLNRVNINVRGEYDES